MAYPLQAYPQARRSWSEETSEKEPQKLSFWGKGKWLISQMRADGTFWQNIAWVVGIIALSVITVLIGIAGVRSIVNAHQKLAEGNWIVVKFFDPNDWRPYSTSDVVGQYLGALGTTAMAALLPICLIFALIKDIKEKYFKPISSNTSETENSTSTKTLPYTPNDRISIEVIDE
jgi:hypothetical protein